MIRKHMGITRRKMSHVIDELYTALFHVGGTKADLHLVREENGIRLLMKSDFLPQHREAVEDMAAMLQPVVRNPALVQSYWELAGGDQYTSDSELSLVGQMLDDAKVTVGENWVEMDLFVGFQQ